MEQDFIKEVVGNLISSLEVIESEGIKNDYSFEIDCESLKDYNHNDIRDSLEFKNIFEDLTILNGPVLYWFEIISSTPRNLIREQITDYAQKEISKATPALKKMFDIYSNCLYVGKVKKGVWGRMIQHLGYYKVERTQGLQLFHWAKGLDLKLKVHLYEFENDIADMVSIFEIEMAKLKKPIIGKH